MSRQIEDTFFKYVRSFMTIYLPRNRCYSANTIKSYRDTINLFREFMAEQKNISFTKIRFSLINHALIYEFMEWLQSERKCKISTCNQRLAAMKSFLNYCALEDSALVAVYMDVKQVSALPDVKAGVSYLSQTAIKTIISQPDSSKKLGLRNRFFMTLMYDTGGRIQEILSLKLRDFTLDFDSPLVYLTGKGNKVRAIPLTDKTIIHLKAYLRIFHPRFPQNADDLLFYTVIHGRKGSISQDTVSKFIKNCADDARLSCPEVPLKIHAHLFRHSRAMHLYQSGIPISYIKDFLGHVSATTTSIYASADTSMIRAALEKAASQNPSSTELPIWDGDEDMILELCGLK